MILSSVFMAWFYDISFNYLLQILNAYITLLKLKKNEGDTHIFVMPSYVAVLWDNNNLEHYMFRRVRIYLLALEIMVMSSV